MNQSLSPCVPDGEMSELVMKMLFKDEKATKSLMDEFSKLLEEGLERNQLFNRRIAQIMMRHRRFRVRILKNIVACYSSNGSDGQLERSFGTQD